MATTIIAIFMASAVLLSPVACTMNRQRIVAEQIGRGSNPIAVKCAIEADTGSSAMCIAYAAGRGQ